MGIDSSGNDVDLSHSEVRLSELLLEYEESLAADPTCAAPEAPPGLDPALADQWRRGCALIQQLNRTFASLAPATSAGAADSASEESRRAGSDTGGIRTPVDLGPTLAAARRSVATPAAPVEHKASNAAEASVPRHIGRYSVWRVAGRGGVGVVYRAFDPVLGRMVALKVPHPETLSSADLRRRFLREAEAAGRLCHPGIVTVFEVRGDDTGCYIATEYCEGPTLAAWLRERAEPMAPRDAAELLSALAAAVQHAHSRGVLHRDIKPTNVMLQLPKGPVNESDSTAGSCRLVPKLGDFGMAKLQEQGGEETRQGTVIGTPEYMSPEQAQGRIEDLDATTDVYALGALLYRLLTGHPPFQGATDAAILHRVVYEEPLAPRRVRRDIPQDLEAICLKCLGKLPSERYATAHELATDLGHFLAGQATIARPLRPWQRLAKWARRRPAIAALTGTLTLLLASLFAMALGYNRQLLMSHEREASALTELQRQADINHRALWAADFAKAWEDMQKNRGAAVRQFFRTYMSPKDEPLRQTFATKLLQRQFDAGDHILYRHDGPVYAAEFSPDGRRIATAGADGQIRIYDLASRHLLLVPDVGAAHVGDINCLAFSHDGAVLVSGGDDGYVRIWNSTTGHLIKDVPTDGQDIHAVCDVAFSPDGALLACAYFDGAVRLRDTTDWHELTISPLRHPGGVLDLSFAADGCRLATVGEDQHLRVWRLPLGTLEHDWPAKKEKCVVARFAHRGQLLASADLHPPAIHFWDPVTGQQTRSVPFGNRWIHAIDFSRDDRWLAFSNKDGAVGLFDLLRGKLGLTLFTNVDCVWTVRLSPRNNDMLLGGDDGSVRLVKFHAMTSLQSERTFAAAVASVAFPAPGDSVAVRLADGLVQLWNQEMTEVRLQLQTQPVIDQQSLLAFAPQGTLAAFVGDDARQVILADTTSGQVRQRLTGSSDNVMSLSFSPESAHLVTGHRGGELRLWDLATGQTVATAATQQPSLYAVGFTADGYRIATAGSNQLRLWDAMTLEQKAEPVVLAGEAYRLAFQPSGSLIAANDADALLLWDSRTFELHRLPAHDAEITTIAFAPAGKMLVTGGNDGTLWLWDLATQRKIAALINGDAPVTCAAFSPDGHVLAAGVTPQRGPQYLKFWNVAPTDGSADVTVTAVDPLHDGCPPSAGAQRTIVDDSSTTIVYANNFDGNERLHDQVLATLSGGVRCPAERFAGLGPPGYAVEGQLLRAVSGEVFRVQLANLPPHDSVDLNFLLAVIDSWDGTQAEAGEFDALEVRVDGVAVFRECFCNKRDQRGQFYMPDSNVRMATTFLKDFGFGPAPDALYDMRHEQAFGLIPHASATLVVEWQAMRPGANTPTEESWALDNLEIVLHGKNNPAAGDTPRPRP